MSLGNTILRELKKEINESEYNRYIKPLIYDVARSRSNVAIFHAPNVIVAKWINTKYAKKISHLFELKNEIKPEIRIEVGTISKQSNKKTLIQNTPNSIKSTNLNPSFTFESFIVGSSNQFAYTTAQSVAEKPGMQYNPLFIYGGVGLGKTHLLQAVGNHYDKQNQHLGINGLNHP